MEFPPTIAGVLEASLGSGSKRALRRDSAALVQALRTRSRSVSRGGVNVLPDLARDGSTIDAAGSHAARAKVTALQRPQDVPLY